MGGGAPDTSGMIAANNAASARAQASIDKYYGLEQQYLSDAQATLKKTLTPWATAGADAYGAYNQAIGLADLKGNKASANTVLSRFQNSPGYQSALKAGMQGLQYSQSAQGISGGAAQKGMIRYASDYGNQGFQSYLNDIGRSVTIGGTMAGALGTGQSALYGAQGNAAQAAGINTANNISGTQAQNSQLQAQSMAAGAQSQGAQLGFLGSALGGVFSLF